MTGSLVILTGAGVSAESGLGTFRDAGGMWKRYDWRELATPEAFAERPEQVHDFYNARRANLAGSKPNAAHSALAELERNWTAGGRRFLLVTQNVDDLHERAGSQALIHMHGELKRMRCSYCGEVRPAPISLSVSDICADCDQAGGLRPHIVWFGELPMQMDQIVSELETCTQFAAIGTSGTVYPAAGFCDIARYAGAHCTEINLAETDQSPAFDAHITGPASETVSVYAQTLLEGAS